MNCRLHLKHLIVKYSQNYRLDGYDWRAAEAQFNSTLPQFRTNVIIPSTLSTPPSHTLRIHFVHKRSKHANAIPLLICHSWPSSFIEVQRLIDALVDPHSLPGFGHGAQQAFHVIAPSIPGFGFSDTSSSNDSGLKETADLFNQLMKQLGYGHYVAHGVGWYAPHNIPRLETDQYRGFGICRALALQHPQHCLAVHTANPTFTAPTFKRSPMAYIKHGTAKLTRGKMSLLNFGYLPKELQSQPQNSNSHQESLYSDRPLGSALHRLYSLRPQTFSFSLCDSPVGLLAALLDVIHTRAPSNSPLTSRSRSPFLSPVELEMQWSNQGEPHTSERVGSALAERPEHPMSPRQSEVEARNYTWSPTEILNWTMMQWLPGEFPSSGFNHVLTADRSRIVPSMASSSSPRLHKPQVGYLHFRTSRYKFLPSA